MKLNVKQRLILPTLLPQKSDLKSQLICREIQEKIKFSTEELERIEFVEEKDVGMKWNSDKAEELEVDFSGSEIDLLKEMVNKLDAEKEISPQLLDICIDIKNL